MFESLGINPTPRAGDRAVQKDIRYQRWGGRGARGPIPSGQNRLALTRAPHLAGCRRNGKRAGLIPKLMITFQDF